MAKRITFDSEIIETLYTSLRQFLSDHLEGVGRMAYSDLDDVDYLVEDNVMDEFCLSPEMEETHGRMARWRCKLGTKCKCWE